MNSLKTLRLILILFFFSCIISSLLTFFLYIETVSLKGPNSTGEAGKVYYAHKYQVGGNFLSTGKHPPYYPAVHGILLHTSVGAIGRLMRANIQELYYIGRSITAIAVLFALVMIFFICKRFIGNSTWSLLSLALFLAPFPLHHFASSYRPDHWILCLSLLSLLICLKRPRGIWFCLLVVLPTISFLIKAPGIIISASIFLSFLIYRRYNMALVYALFSAAIFCITIAFLQWITHGLLAAAFFSGMKTGFSISNTLSSFDHPALWLPILLVPIFYAYLNRHSNIKKESLHIIFAFWAVATMVAFVIAARYGSNVNYFLQSYAYGTIIFICWLHTKYNKFDSETLLAKRGMITFFVILIMTSAFIIIPLINFMVAPRIDSAAVITKVFGKERQHIADFINQNALKCYSNDPGLNVLLNNPMVIYPYLQNVFFRSGYLNKESFFNQIKRGNFDLIILTGWKWRYQGINQYPEKFMFFVHKYYQELKTSPVMKYSIYIPKSHGNSMKIKTFFPMKSY